MIKVLFFTIIYSFLYQCCFAQQTTLFLINSNTDSQNVIDVVDSNKLLFYAINDSFVFTSDYDGVYRLADIENNTIKVGDVKPKIRFPKIPISFSGFRGNTPHIGISQSTHIYEFHIDNNINYFNGSTIGDILQVTYLPKYSAVLLHLLHDKEPERHQLELFPSFAVKNKKSIYKNVPTLIKAPTTIHETSNISKISIHEESTKVAFLANDTVLMLYNLKDLTNSYGFYDQGTGFDFGFYNADSIFIIQQDGKASMLSLPKNYSRPINTVIELNGMQDFHIVNKHLFCTKGNTLYVNQITSNSVQPIKKYSFGTKIISYKVSNDGTKVLVLTGN